jgi:hypothetical protein
MAMPSATNDDEGDQGQGEGDALLMQADEGQRREEQHRALGEVEYARCLVDQHEANRDERIHHADREAGDENLEEEIPGAHAASTASLPTLSSPSLSWATPR